MVLTFLLSSGHLMAQQEDTSSTKLIAAYPIGFFSPETSLAFGAGGVYTFSIDTVDGLQRNSNLQGYAVYTLNKQVLFQLPFQRFTQEHYISGEVSYFRFPYLFYGLGDTVTTSNSEFYDARFARASLNGYKRIASRTYVGLRAWYDDFFEITPEEGASLGTGNLLGRAGGENLGAGLGFLFDGRDHLFYTTAGFYADVSLMQFQFSDNATARNASYATLRADLRYFIPLGGNKQVLSFQGLGILKPGNVPFHQLSMLGGLRYLRGYYDGLFRDRNLLSAQVEYKRFVLPRWGFALFGGAGTVWGQRTDWPLLPAGGAGLRFLLDRKQDINVRIDYGVGKESSGIYVTVIEAF